MSVPDTIKPYAATGRAKAWENAKTQSLRDKRQDFIGEKQRMTQG